VRRKILWNWLMTTIALVDDDKNILSSLTIALEQEDLGKTAPGALFA